MDRQEVLTKVQELLQAQAGERSIQLDGAGQLAAMGFDSLALSEIIVAVEEAFDCVLRMDDLMNLKTLNDLADIIIDRSAQL